MPVVVPFAECIARPSDQKRQFLLEDHLHEVAHSAGKAKGTWPQQLCFLAGLLHDVGKAQSSWQYGIQRVEKKAKRLVPHAFLGSALFFTCALELGKSIQPGRGDDVTFQNMVLQLSADIADHHGQLKDLVEERPPWVGGWQHGCFEHVDFDGLIAFVATWFPQLNNLRRMLDDERAYLLQERKRWRRLIIQSQGGLGQFPDMHARSGILAFHRFHTGRLIAGDRLSVAEADHSYLTKEQAEKAVQRMGEFVQKRASTLEKNYATELNSVRQQAQKAIVEKYINQPHHSFYTLHLPTGLGKTLSALRVALEAHRLGRASRIIYVAPYLSVLSQAADELRKATGIEVMEHHHIAAAKQFTNAQGEGNEDEALSSVNTTIMESWQAPIVATTFHQLFRGIAPRSAQHAIRTAAMKQAFIVLDEPQVIHSDVWRMFVTLMSAYAKQLDMTVLFITATMPPLSDLPEPPYELAPDQLTLPNRYNIHVSNVTMDAQAVAHRIVHEDKAMQYTAVIVNTIQDAFDVFAALRTVLPDDGRLFNLHGAMTSLHKRYVIDAIGRRLKQKKPTVVVATQIIEAGVDLSFDIIYRARSVIPSVMQTAGRANRHAAHGQEPSSVIDFHMVRSDGRDMRSYVYDRVAADITDTLLRDKNIISEEHLTATCATYYETLYERSPGTSALNYVDEAARGAWSKLHSIDPFIETYHTLSVFVPNEGPWIDKSTRSLLEHFDVYTTEELYERYTDPSWLNSLDFSQRKLFLTTMQRFVVPLTFDKAKSITNIHDTPLHMDPHRFIFKLENQDMYKEDTGFGNVMQDVEDWNPIL